MLERCLPRQAAFQAIRAPNTVALDATTTHRVAVPSPFRSKLSDVTRPYFLVSPCTSSAVISFAGIPRCRALAGATPAAKSGPAGAPAIGVMSSTPAASRYREARRRCALKL